jgi:hypothetical protein
MAGNVKLVQPAVYLIKYFVSHYSTMYPTICAIHDGMAVIRVFAS